MLVITKQECPTQFCHVQEIIHIRKETLGCIIVDLMEDFYNAITIPCIDWIVDTPTPWVDLGLPV
jgi:hypothetical protein